MSVGRGGEGGKEEEKGRMGWEMGWDGRWDGMGEREWERGRVEGGRVERGWDGMRDERE